LLDRFLFPLSRVSVSILVAWVLGRAAGTNPALSSRGRKSVRNTVPALTVVRSLAWTQALRSAWAEYVLEKHEDEAVQRSPTSASWRRLGMFVVSPIAFLGFIDIWPGELQTAEMEHRRAQGKSRKQPDTGRSRKRKREEGAGPGGKDHLARRMLDRVKRVFKNGEGSPNNTLDRGTPASGTKKPFQSSRIEWVPSCPDPNPR